MLRILEIFISIPIRFIYSKYLEFVSYLFETCDPTSLAIFRILFGFCMILDIPQERGLEDADIRFGDLNYCFFPLFEWIQPVSVQNACVLYSIMWAGAFGMMIGCKFRVSCISFLIPYLYFFLLDKSRWNNHSYLFALFTILLLGSGAGDHLSIDALSQDTDKRSSGVPKWNYFILKFQIFILYFYAGIKKLDSDWVSGYSMKNLSRHKIFSPIKILLEADVIEYYMVHIGGLIYDLSVGFMLNFELSKKMGVFFSVAFHGMNCQIFDIGMFPYVCLASLILFFKPDQFPCSLFADSSISQTLVGCDGDDKPSRSPSKKMDFVMGKDVKKLRPRKSQRKSSQIKKNLKAGLLSFYILVQLFMPFSHFITRGYNNWTAGLYGYSWDMMVNSWETLHQKVTVINRSTGQERYLDPDVWVANDRWSSHADMARQYAQCISRNLGRFNITDIEVRLDVWKSLNGRFQQRIYDPRVDILTAPWSPFEPVSWVLPLLKEFSHYRRDLFDTVSHDVANWTTSSDVIFVADFPGLYLENFLPSELINITVSLISGEIVVEQKGMENATLSSWNGKTRQSVFNNEFHKIHTISYQNPSCYMYTYTNATQEAQNRRAQAISGDNSTGNGNSETEELSVLYQIYKTIVDFLSEKCEVFSRSLYLVMNAHLSLLFDVPMVLRKSLDG